MTQTAFENHKELTTDSFFNPVEEFNDENRKKLMALQYSFFSQQPISDPPKIDLRNCWQNMRDYPQMDIVNELITRYFHPPCCSDDTVTETISSEEPEIRFERNVSNVVVSEKVATKLRAKEISAFVPVSATDLVWIEALSMDEELDE